MERGPEGDCARSIKEGRGNPDGHAICQEVRGGASCNPVAAADAKQKTRDRAHPDPEAFREGLRRLEAWRSKDSHQRMNRTSTPVSSAMMAASAIRPSRSFMKTSAAA
jgi:hypothetical protein